MEAKGAPIELETPRLRLRAWRDDDLPAFAAMNADAEIMRYFPKPLGRKSSDALAALIRQHDHFQMLLQKSQILIERRGRKRGPRRCHDQPERQTETRK